MPDLTVSYGTPFDIIAFLGILIHYWQSFMSELLYLHQSFTYCVSNQYANTNISTCQMWLYVMECFLILLRFFANFAHNWRISCLKFCIFTKLSRIVSLISTHILICSHARLVGKLKTKMWLQVVECPLIMLCTYFENFSHIINNHSWLKCCIFAKLLQTGYLINFHNLVCWYARCKCRLWKVIWFKFVY